MKLVPLTLPPSLKLAPQEIERNQQKTVIVGMSGGVDSSVAALILKEQGYRVIGLFMKNWEETEEDIKDGHCQAARDFEDVVSVCEILDIPYYSINLAQDYWDRVFLRFLDEYKAGATPNPDILCNREIKFSVFFEKAMQLGADYLATGHYCQIRTIKSESNERADFQLIKGRDPGKDQSYFLYTLRSSILEKVLFPIGSLLKEDVRNLAKEYGLPTFAKKDSTGICFIGERNFPRFLNQYISFSAGNFETLDGKVVGKHYGIPFYTIGQRKGLGLGGPGEAWYVVGKDIKKNVVQVERGDLHPALFIDELTATEMSWVNYFTPNALPLSCKAKIRYRQQDQECTIVRIEGDKVWVRFKWPQRAATPRQAIVFYQDDRCLGGGLIEFVGPNYYQLGKNLPKELISKEIS